MKEGDQDVINKGTTPVREQGSQIELKLNQQAVVAEDLEDPTGGPRAGMALQRGLTLRPSTINHRMDLLLAPGWGWGF